MATTTTTTTTAAGTSTTTTTELVYCRDEDLVALRSNILDFGIDSWKDQRDEAMAIIDRALDAGWYRQEAEHLGVDWRKYPMDRTLFLNAESQLKRLACYKALELAFRYLMKESPEPDSFERMKDMYKEEYQSELKAVLNAGLDYDWDGSGALTAYEKSRPVRRRLSRC